MAEPIEKVKYAFNKALSIDRATKTLIATVTVRKVDRDGDLVEPEGMDFTNFMKNPVVLFAHRRGDLPIGKVTQIFKSPEAVLAEVKFAEHKFAQDVFDLYAEGVLNGWSPGFSAKREDVDPIIDQESGEPTGLHIKKSEALELSSAPIPANADALTKGLGGIDPDTRAMLMKSYDETIEQWKLDGVKTLQDVLEKEFTREDHNSTLADDEPSWGTIDKAQLPVVAAVWQKSGTNAAEKDTFEFFHHWISNPENPNEKGIVTTGEMFLHEAGLRSAWSLAMGARSGEEAERSVINHLQKHRLDIGVAENSRKHHYIRIEDGEDSILFSEKKFERLEENESPFEQSDKTLSEQVFKQTLRTSMAGKIPVHISIGEKFSAEIDFEPMQHKGDEITEVKVLKVEMVLPSTFSDKSLPEDKEGRKSEKTPGSTDSIKSSSDEAANLMKNMLLENTRLGLKVQLLEK